MIIEKPTDVFIADLVQPLLLLPLNRFTLTMDDGVRCHDAKFPGVHSHNLRWSASTSVLIKPHQPLPTTPMQTKDARRSNTAASTGEALRQNQCKTSARNHATTTYSSTPNDRSLRAPLHLLASSSYPSPRNTQLPFMTKWAVMLKHYVGDYLFKRHRRTAPHSQLQAYATTSWHACRLRTLNSTGLKPPRTRNRSFLRTGL